MYWRSGRLHCLVVVVVALLSLGPAWAQYGMMDGDGPSALGTPNLPGVEPQGKGSTSVWGEARVWEGDNWTFAAGVRANVGEDSDVELTIFNLDTSGEDAINGAVRDSEATLIGLNYRWVAFRNERVSLAVIPGAEFPIDDMEGTNTAIPATAMSGDLIPLISLPVEHVLADGTILRVVPRYVGFDDNPELANGTTIEGFGDVIGLGFGLRRQIEEFAVMGDVTVILDGNNSIDENTNEPTDEFVWSAGGSWQGVDSPVRVDLFVTNAAGPTGASSIIATPDQSVGIGLRVSGEF